MTARSKHRQKPGKSENPARLEKSEMSELPAAPVLTVDTPVSKRERLTQIITLLWRYLVLAFLLASLAFEALSYSVVGDELSLQSPPNGYKAEETSIRMSWSAQGFEPPFVVELIKAEGSFETPEKQLKAWSDFLILPPLEPDQKWQWRVRHEGSGRVSATGYFSSAEHSIRY